MKLFHSFILFQYQVIQCFCQSNFLFHGIAIWINFTKFLVIRNIFLYFQIIDKIFIITYISLFHRTFIFFQNQIIQHFRQSNLRNFIISFFLVNGSFTGIFVNIDMLPQFGVFLQIIQKIAIFVVIAGNTASFLMDFVDAFQFPFSINEKILSYIYGRA